MACKHLRTWSKAIALALVSAALLGGSLAAAQGNSSKPLIYVIGYQVNNPFWVLEGKGAKAAGDTFGVNVRYEAPAKASSRGMINLIQAALGNHPAGIAIDYTGKVMEKSVLQALQDGVNVVLYNNNRFSPQAGGATTNTKVTNLAFVGQNEHTSGTILAQHFLPYLPGKGTVLIVNPFPQAFVLTLRYQGVKSVLEKAGYQTALLRASGNEPKNEQLVGSYLQAHSDVVGIVGLGDPATDPAAKYVSSHNLDIPLATFDVDSETYHLMQTVSQYKVALDQQPYLQAYYAVANLALQAKYGFQPVNINTGSLVVTKDNLDQLTKLVQNGLD